MFSHEFCVGNEALQIRLFEVCKDVKSPDVVVYLYYRSLQKMIVRYIQKSELDNYINGSFSNYFVRFEYLNVPNF